MLPVRISAYKAVEDCAKMMQSTFDQKELYLKLKPLKMSSGTPL